MEGGLEFKPEMKIPQEQQGSNFMPTNPDNMFGGSMQLEGGEGVIPNMPRLTTGGGRGFRATKPQISAGRLAPIEGFMNEQRGRLSLIHI